MANVSSSNGLEKRPKLRFPGFDEPWKETNLSTLFSKSTQKNADGHITNVICNSAKLGLIPQREYFDKDIANSDNTSGYYIIRQNDFVYNPRKSSDAPYGPISSYKYAEDGIVSPLYLCFHAKGEINPLYYEWYFRSSAWHRYIYMSGDSGARHDRVSIKDDTFFAMPINLPSEQEQSKIASFLQSLDERIAAQEKLVASLKKYKRGLLSQLIAQKKAFDTSGEWKTVKLGHIFKERTERAKGNETLLAVTISNGVQRRDEIDLKDNSSDDKSNYKCVYIGDIAYNTMRMWQGASGVSPYNGIVSPAYTIVTPIRPDLHNMTFWAYYFKYSPLVQTFQKYSQGLTSDTWNLKFPQFSEIAVTMPPISEQDKIAECLSVFDEHCKCEDEKLQALLQVRTSLLQQLFI